MECVREFTVRTGQNASRMLPGPTKGPWNRPAMADRQHRTHATSRIVRPEISDPAAVSYLDLIIETAPDAIITIDAAGVIQSFTPAAQRMFGYTEDEAVGQNVSLLMPEPDRAGHDTYMQRYMETGEKHVIGIGRLVRAQRKNGEVFQAELAVGEWNTAAGPVFTGFMRDVSDRVEAQRKANRLQRSLDRLSRVHTLGEVSTALAHEINQPLTAIATYTQAAQRMLDASEPDVGRTSEILERVAGEALRAGEILKRMRRLIDQGRVDLQPENINEIVQEAVRLAEAGLPHEGVDVVYDLSDDLPLVLADRVQIQQVVINLMRNAADAMNNENPGDLHIETVLEDPSGAVTVSAMRHDDGEVRVTISDTGPGVPVSLFGDLFEPFITGRPGGLGVGLAICRSIIRAHGGRIWAENKPDGGACFHFTLPAAPP